MSLDKTIRAVLVLLLTASSLVLPIVGDASALFGGGAAGAALGFCLVAVLYWIIISKLRDFLVFAFGGGVGRYSTTKPYRRVQWFTFALLMTLPVFVLATLLITASPVGQHSDSYTSTVNRVERERLAAARAQQRELYNAASRDRLRRIEAAKAARQARINEARRLRDIRVARAEAEQKQAIETERDARLAEVDARLGEIDEQFDTLYQTFAFAHLNNDDYWREINAFAVAFERRFGIYLSKARREMLARLVSKELEAFDRVYIQNDCRQLVRDNDTRELKRLRIYEMCTAFVVWLNLAANDLQTATGQPLYLPAMQRLGNALRELPPVYEEQDALAAQLDGIKKAANEAIDAIEVDEPFIDEADFPQVQLSEFPNVELDQFPLVVDESPIEADDPYVERISPTFLAHWWWIAPVSFVAWLVVQAESQRGISRVYSRIIRFFDEGRFGFGGSARFTSMFEEWGKPYKPGTLYMGRSLYNRRDEIGLDGEAHMLTIAGSRGGKGVSAIIPNLLLWEGSCVVVDPKGTNARVTAEARRRMGHDVYLIDPLQYVTKDGDSFDPLADIDPNDSRIREKIASIADALVIQDPNAKDPHWDDGARTIIAGLISHVVSGQSGGEKKLHTVRDLIKRLPEDQDRMWAEMAFNEDAGGYAKDAAMRYIRGSETNEILGIMSNADKHTEWLSSEAMREATSHADFRLSDLKKKPTTVYLIIPPRELTRQKRFTRLFVNLMLDAMEDGGRSDIPVLMMIDEFLALDYMPEIPTAFATMASYNLVLWPFVQDMQKLKETYKNDFNAFIANSRAVQVFSTTDEVTKEYVSNRLGNRPMSGLASITRSSETVPLRSADDVEKDLDADELRQYVIERGRPPMLLERVPYFKPNTRFAGKYDPDPDFVKKT